MLRPELFPQGREVLDHLSALQDQLDQGDQPALDPPFRQVGPPLLASPFGPWLPSPQLAKQKENAIRIATSLIRMLLHLLTMMTSRPTPLGRVMCRCGSKLARRGARPPWQGQGR